MVEQASREWVLACRPEGEPQERDFELVERPVPAPAEGEVLVRNLYMSVDPYMRGRMRDAPSYAPSWEVGETMQGAAVGRVVRSAHADFADGDLVSSNRGWREYFTAAGGTLGRIDPEIAPPSYHLGVLGMPGLTAYAGVLDVGGAKDGETVFVSGAAGAVGSVAGQVAKVTGCRVVGSAGSDEKVRWLLDDLGFDAAFNYRDGDLEGALASAAPEGVDVYFDNVGGEHLQAAISQMNPLGRIAACGSVSRYNAIEPEPGPNNLGLIVGSRITIRGFLVSDFAHRRPAFLADMRRWLAEGAVRYRETVVDGIEHAPRAFIGLFHGDNVGKMVVRLAEE